MFRTYIRAGKLCPDFFFHEPLAGLYAEKKKQKAMSDVSAFVLKRNIIPFEQLLFHEQERSQAGEKVKKPVQLIY